MFQTYVSSASSRCCICCFGSTSCFEYMFQVFQTLLQVFHLDVTKVNLDVAMPIHACFKRMFQVFYLFQTYVANVLSECFKNRSGVAWRRWPADSGLPQPLLWRAMGHRVGARGW